MKIPVSEVTAIATALGLFFLIVAFYKSVFHKRPSPTQAALQKNPPVKAETAAEQQQPVKLSDPFQQVPVDAIPAHSQKTEGNNASVFYPKIQQASSTYVSAFRQYNPNLLFDEAAHTSKNMTTYEWE